MPTNIESHPFWKGDGALLAASANTVEKWLALRDVEKLESDDLYPVLGDECADLMVVFGGGVVQAANTLAEAMHTGIAHRFAIVGGKGRATWNLRLFMREYAAEHPQSEPVAKVDVENDSEAQLLNAFLQAEHGLAADWLETRSTNCGNNISFMLDHLESIGYYPRSIILSQDAVMQRRMLATILHQGQNRPAFHGLRIVNYAYYDAKLTFNEGELRYLEPVPLGMWPPQTYLEHLASEVHRLYDDQNGYGPRGKDYLVHVDVPEDVLAAAHTIEEALPRAVTYGSSEFASPKE